MRAEEIFIGGGRSGSNQKTAYNFQPSHLSHTFHYWVEMNIQYVGMEELFNYPYYNITSCCSYLNP